MFFACLTVQISNRPLKGWRVTHALARVRTHTHTYIFYTQIIHLQNQKRYSHTCIWYSDNTTKENLAKSIHNVHGKAQQRWHFSISYTCMWTQKMFMRKCLLKFRVDACPDKAFCPISFLICFSRYLHINVIHTQE